MKISIEELAQILQSLKEHERNKLARRMSVNVVHLAAALRPRDCAEPGHRPQGLSSRDVQGKFGITRGAGPEDD